MAAKPASHYESQTPEQQAALQALENGWMRERLLEGVAATGTIEDAAHIIGLNPSTVHRWMNIDESFREQVLAAKVRCSEKLLGKSVAAWLTASPEELRKAGVAYIAVMNWLDTSKRPNPPTINVDARTVTLNQMDPKLLEEKHAIYMAAAKASQIGEVTETVTDGAD